MNGRTDVDDTAPSIPERCLERLSLEPVRYLGGRENQHWLVKGLRTELVLRGYSKEQVARWDIGYEHEVLRRLHALGWPVPELASEPIQEDGRVWCLFTLLPGEPLTTNDASEQRSRGRLLAEFHESTALLVDMGQREGFPRADDLVSSPGLVASIRAYERLRPVSGHILRWHLEKTKEGFERIALDRAETIVLHSDFTPWNLLFERGKLSGVLDFEATHLNYRVSDFMNSWRGSQDEVIRGYEQVRELTELDRQLLVPAFWAWLFLGVEEAINRIISGEDPPHDFDWQTKHLLRRSRLYGDWIEPYPRPK